MRRPIIMLIIALALALLAAPLVADAQPASQAYRIGVLISDATGWRKPWDPYNKLFDALRDLGYAEGRNLVIELRSFEGKPDRLPGLAAELVQLKVDVIVVSSCDARLKAARQATSTIPIVVAACHDDMVKTGVVASLARPGGNLTGFQLLTPELGPKRLALLKEAVPTASRVGVLWNPAYSDWSADWTELRAAARALGVTLHSAEARSADDLPTAFAAMAAAHAGAVISFPDTMTYIHRKRVAELAARSRLPLMAPFREMADAGGLLAYGPNIPDLFRRTATFVDKILKGAKPADLPVEQPTKFELVINLTTAKTLRLTLPQSLLLRADEVIR